MSATQTTPFGFRCGQKDKKTTRTVRLQNVKLTQKALLSFNVCCVFFFLDVFPCVSPLRKIGALQRLALLGFALCRF